MPANVIWLVTGAETQTFNLPVMQLAFSEFVGAAFAQSVVVIIEVQCVDWL